jgi:hypothetical protein
MHPLVTGMNLLLIWTQVKSAENLLWLRIRNARQEMPEEQKSIEPSHTTAESSWD